MKIPFLFLTALLLTGEAVFAKDKVIERSGKQPAWVNTMMTPDYIISVADAATIGEAQQKALLLVKQEIVRGIAEQVMSSSILSRQEMDVETTESYTQNIIAKAVKVPFVQGISANQMEAVYWEKIRRDKQMEFYRYYVKYPFSKAQMNNLTAEFKKEDFKITQRLEELENGLSQIESVEQICMAAAELDKLFKTLDDPRKDRAMLLYSRCRELVALIYITQINNERGHIEYQLSIGDKLILCTQTPKVKSECASITKIKVGDVCSVDYFFDGCYLDMENFIEISYHFGYKTLKHKFLIPHKHYTDSTE
ncbi:MAG: hypothetical protein LBS08_01460 [Candidatus Symbiothrix sp.]|jgi:hypothetical protein|nr:hypothetical protein [Candidatus Symbiothrix sp.]